MARYAKTLSAYRALGIGLATEEWIETIWEGNFCELAAVPETREGEGWDTKTEEWKAVAETSRLWVQRADSGVSFISPGGDDDENSTHDGGGVGFWTTLFDAGVSHKALMAIIYYQLDQPRLSGKLCAASAAQLYFNLLQIPGTTAYKTFHPMIFEKALDVLKLYPA